MKGLAGRTRLLVALAVLSMLAVLGAAVLSVVQVRQGPFADPRQVNWRDSVSGLVFGFEREHARFRGEQLGFVFQSSYLLPHMSVLDNLLLAVEHLPGSLKPWSTRALQLLEQMGIAELAQRRPHQISGGQAQRAAIARALMRDPVLILADEPTGSLDQDSAAAVLELLTGLTRAGKAVLVVTHNAEVARALTRTVTLRNGRLAAAI